MSTSATPAERIEQTRLLSARQETARVRAELVDLRAEAEAWRGTIADLEQKAMELQTQLDAGAARLDRIKRACEEAPAAMRQSLDRILAELS